jgi:hypothetical protein
LQLVFGQKHDAWICSKSGQLKFVGFYPQIQRLPGGLQNDLKCVARVRLNPFFDPAKSEPGEYDHQGDKRAC